MTRESLALFDTAALEARIGSASVAKGLNDQIRFRLAATGGSEQWTLVPDNRLSADLLASEPGVRLATRLRALVGAVDVSRAAGSFAPRGIVLADDAQGIAAAWELMRRDEARVTGRPARAIADAMAGAESLVRGGTSAHAEANWVVVSPDAARSMLTSVNAYTPGAREPYSRTGWPAAEMGQLLAHEWQHLVSPADARTPDGIEALQPIMWMEEGTASLFSYVGSDRDSVGKAWNITEAQHDAQIHRPDEFETGWTTTDTYASLPPGMAFPAPDGHVYAPEVGILQRLLALAGIDSTMSSGRDAANRLLQGVPLAAMPKRVASALLRAKGAEPTDERVARLAALVSRAIDPGGIGAVEVELRAER